MSDYAINTKCVQGGYTPGQVCAAPFNAHQHYILARSVAFEYLRGEAFKYARHFVFFQ